MASSGLRSVSSATWKKLLAGGLMGREASNSVSVSAGKIEKMISLLQATTRDVFYRSLVREGNVSIIRDTVSSQRNERLERIQGSLMAEARRCNFAEDMMLADMLTYLPGDILVKVDRSAMANSVESRAPFLDHRVISLACRLPIDFKIRDGAGKYILKEALGMFVPRKLTQRPKAGFAVPIDEWLRGPLKEWCNDLLETRGISEAGIFYPENVAGLVNDHMSGRKDNGLTLWRLLMFQSWSQKEC
jgi:asparagine synthase (glutamine-hydrolysing)